MSGLGFWVLVLGIWLLGSGIRVVGLRAHKKDMPGEVLVRRLRIKTDTDNAETWEQEARP